jgi:hypothetical protein
LLDVNVLVALAWPNHLLAVALAHRGMLATFDRGLAELVPDGVPATAAVHVIPT